MIQIHDIYLPLGYSEKDIAEAAAKKLGLKPDELKDTFLLRRSVDARKRGDIHFTATVCAKTDAEKKLLKKFPENAVSAYAEAAYEPPEREFSQDRRSPVVIGFGPAGMFAALTLARSGARPVVLERGQDCTSRVKSIEKFHESGVLDTESNVQFGEGGAGTFSDGKLTTGIRDPRIRHVFKTLVRFGAPEEILYLAKPHIGTDLLRTTVQNLRREVISLGGTVIFGAKLTDIKIKNGRVSSAVYERNGITEELETDSIILAIGHSARDTFEMLYKKNIAMSQKSFAMGVRIEHLQSEVNKCLYGEFAGHPALSAADYKLAVHLPDGRALYTFCMCPGGYVVGAASEKDSVVTNGMSLFARDGVNANSALLVNTDPRDLGSGCALAGMELQRRIERAAFAAGGGGYKAPCILAGDLLENKASSSFGSVEPTYRPGTSFASPEKYLPEFIVGALKEGLPLLMKRMSFFRAGDAVITGAETRSSSPVRILRGDTLASLSVKGLYPCGEGAGYAGGIVSAAVDGIKCAEGVLQNG